MGVWGGGLYSGDFAKDLRTTVAAVSRLPYENHRLLEILCGLEPDAANNQNHEDYTTFWLVLADQFSKRGIDERTLREQALQIIDDESDIRKLRELGMAETDLRKRRQTLAGLRSSLIAPVAAKRRAVLQKPQPLIMEIGDAFTYPTSQGKCINPYLASKNRIPGWKQDSWSAAIIIDRGLAFDFLAWYRPLSIATFLVNPPDAEVLAEPERSWVLRRPGTLSALHYRRMEINKIASLAVNQEKVNRAFPPMSPGTYQAIHDISIANELSVGPARNFDARYPRISGLGEIIDQRPHARGVS